MSTTTTTRAAAVALLMALLVLGVAALPVSAQTDSGSGGSFGLDAATETGGATVELGVQAESTEDPAAGGTTMGVPSEATVGTTVDIPATASEQPGGTPDYTASQYQYGMLADTGGVPPHRPLLFGGVVAAALVALAIVHRRALRLQTNGKDEDVYFG